MLFRIPYINHSASEGLHTQLIYFFSQLVSIDCRTNIEPLTQYFNTSFHSTLNAGPKLQEKVRKFLTAYKGLSASNKILVRDTFTNSQQIQIIVEDVTFDGNAINKLVLPASIRNKAYNLFIHLYEITLKTSGDIGTHYHLFYDAIEHKVCPFCGVENLFAPHRRKQDYDHIIKKETYPFPSVNMRNLVPMGRDCNQVYKGRTDVLYSGTVRKVFAYPFSRHYNIIVSLQGSTLPKSTGPHQNGDWKINFNITNDFVESWDRIFDIRNRYSEEFLKKFWKEWLDEFKRRAKANRVNTIRKLVRAYRQEATYLTPGFSDNKMIKTAFFRFLADSGDVAFNQAVLKEINS